MLLMALNLVRKKLIMARRDMNYVTNWLLISYRAIRHYPLRASVGFAYLNKNVYICSINN